MQGDGNLVEYVGGRALWSAETAGHPDAWLAMQGDGNLVVYSATNQPLWSAGTDANPGDHLALQPDANLVVYSLANVALWSNSPTNTIIGSGETLASGQILLSSDRHYELAMQGDGNLVEYVAGRALWSSGTSGNPGAYVTMQSSDGNLVLYSASHKPLWASSTSGAGAYLALQPDANLVVYSSANAALWSSASINSTLQPGEVLSGSQSQSVRSADGRFIFVMQGDGNLVLYGPEGALWSSGTFGNPGAYLGMQGTDGNLVVYSASNQPLWSSGTAASPGDHLVVQTDGNVVVYAAGGEALWATNTAGGSSPAGGHGEAIVQAAAKWAGTQYCFGGGDRNGPTHSGACASGTVGFDCTGLTLYAVYQATGILLPHSTGQDSGHGGMAVAKAELQPGDIVFFGPSLVNYTHAGIYAGTGKMWDAADVGIPVQMHSLYSNYVGATRYWH